MTRSEVQPRLVRQSGVSAPSAVGLTDDPDPGPGGCGRRSHQVLGGAGDRVLPPTHLAFYTPQFCGLDSSSRVYRLV
jgi:hypothetical protein